LIGDWNAVVNKTSVKLLRIKWVKRIYCKTLEVY